MTAFSALEVLRHFFGSRSSGGLSLEMLRSGLFEEQLKLASQLGSPLSDEEHRQSSLPMIRKTLPIGPPISAPLPEATDASGRDEKAGQRPIQTGQQPDSTLPPPPTPSEKVPSPSASNREKCSLPQMKKNQDQEQSLGSAPGEIVANNLSPSENPSAREEFFLGPVQSTLGEEPVAQRPFPETHLDSPQHSGTIPDYNEQINPQKGPTALEPIELPEGSGQAVSPPVAQSPMGDSTQEGGFEMAPTPGGDPRKEMVDLEGNPVGESRSENAMVLGVLESESAGVGRPGAERTDSFPAGLVGSNEEQKATNVQTSHIGVGAALTPDAPINPTGSVAPLASMAIVPATQVSGTASSGSGGSLLTAAETAQSGRTDGTAGTTPAIREAGNVSSAFSVSRGVSTADQRPGKQAVETSSQEANVQRVRFIQRVVRAFQALRDGGGPLRLRLHPPELGSLRLELLVREGVLRARMEVENTAARTAILEHLPMLRERLAQQDIRIEQFEVEIGEGSSGSHSHQPDYSTSEHQGAAFSAFQNRPRNANSVSPPTLPGTPLAASESSKLNVVI